MDLICSVEDFRDEIAAIRELAVDFLDSTSTVALNRVAAAVDQVLVAKQQVRLEITDEVPVRTVPCAGGYERGNGGEHRGVYAHLTFAWDVTPLGDPSKKVRDRAFVISGIASTLITLFDQQPGGRDEELGSWRLEIAYDQQGKEPGAYFHAQIGGANRTPTWSKGIPVPRLGVLPFTPMLALEYVLGELFQEGWPNHLQTAGPAKGKWSRLHLDRLHRYATWLAGTWQTTPGTSPLMAYKQADPPSDLFVGKRFQPAQLRRP